MTKAGGAHWCAPPRSPRGRQHRCAEPETNFASLAGSNPSLSITNIHLSTSGPRRRTHEHDHSGGRRWCSTALADRSTQQTPDLDARGLAEASELVGVSSTASCCRACAPRITVALTSTCTRSSSQPSSRRHDSPINSAVAQWSTASASYADHRWFESILHYHFPRPAFPVPAFPLVRGVIAQCLAEHPVCSREVAGSNPAGSTLFDPPIH